MEVVGSLHGLTHVQSNVTELKKGLQHLSNATTKIISMTVTEKGYHQNNSDGGLDFNHEDIQHDLHQLSQGVTDVHAIYPLKTTLGLITAGLLLRKNKDVGGGESVTLLCCDNLPHNGNVLKRLVNEISEAVDPSLHEWIQSNVSFPNSMVDRITPAATDSTKLRIEKEMNIKDASPIQAEDFIQWVVEDNFQNGRPKWEDIECVTFVDDVIPYENMKLRMLNGGHSSLAYIASLLFMKESDQSKVTVDRVMRDKDVEQFVVQYMNEVMPTLNGGPEGPEALLDYQTSLIERFHNSEISDAVSRLCQDGSKKVTGFIVPPLKELIQNIQKENGDPKQIDMICKVIASWYVYLSCWKEVDDPSGDELVRLACGGELKQFLVVGLGSELGCNEMVWKKVETEVLFLKQNGPREFLKRC